MVGCATKAAKPSGEFSITNIAKFAPEFPAVKFKVHIPDTGLLMVKESPNSSTPCSPAVCGKAEKSTACPVGLIREKLSAPSEIIVLIFKRSVVPKLKVTD